MRSPSSRSSTDTGGTQLKNAQAVLDKFPAHTKLIASFEKSVASSGMNLAQLESSVGPELDVAILKIDGKPAPVGFTKPKDAAAFAAQLKKAKSEQISGWTVFASTQAALDAVKNRTTNLSDASDYQDASKSLPGDTLATAFAGKSAFALAGPLADKASSQAGAAASAIDLSKLGWVAGAVTSHDDGIEVELHAHSTSAPRPPRARESLAGEIPGGVLAAASFDGSRNISSLSDFGARATRAPQSILAQVQKVLGVSVQDIVQAVNGPAILYLKAGAPLPEVTVVVKPADAQKAAQTVGTLIGEVREEREADVHDGERRHAAERLGRAGQHLLRCAQRPTGAHRQPDRDRRAAVDEQPARRRRRVQGGEEGVRAPRFVAGVALRGSAEHDPRRRGRSPPSRARRCRRRSARIWRR